MAESDCIFCRIVERDMEAAVVHEDELSIVFLDTGPIFPGHCLVCPKQHIQTLPDMPPELLRPFFETVQLTVRAVERGLGAQGAFVAQNNKVSQSVPHLHVHVIPRSRGDGMKGFFWPRRPYRDKNHMAEIRQALSDAIHYFKR